jgi:two-component system, OmpR family, alkaline phosphatase synthesis response regulator PhoP
MKNYKILIVEDEPNLNELLSYNFKKVGFEVRSASNGMKALRMLRAYHPDVILADIMMPDMDGIKMCRELKKIKTHQHIPVIFLSGTNDDYKFLSAMEAGAVDYVSKPVSIPFLMRMVDSTLKDSGEDPALFL